MSHISDRERRHMIRERKALEKERDSLLRELRRQSIISRTPQTEKQNVSARENISLSRDSVSFDKSAKGMEEKRKSEKKEVIPNAEEQSPVTREEDRRLGIAAHWTPEDIDLTSTGARRKTLQPHYQEEQQDISVFSRFSDQGENTGEYLFDENPYFSEEEFRTIGEIGYSKGNSRSFDNEIKEISKDEQKIREMLHGMIDSHNIREGRTEKEKTSQFEGTLHGVRSNKHHSITCDTAARPFADIQRQDEKELTKRQVAEQLQLLKLQQLKKTEEKLQLLRQEQQGLFPRIERSAGACIKKECTDRRDIGSEENEMSDRIKLLLTEERKLDEHRLLKEKREAELQARIKALEEKESLVQDETMRRQRLMLMKQEEDRLERILLQKIKTDIQIQ